MNAQTAIINAFVLPTGLLKMIARTLLLLSSLYLLHLSWIPAKAWLAQILLERSWQQTLSSQSHSSHSSGDNGLFATPRYKPWPWSDSWPVASLYIPKLERKLIVLANSSGQSLAFGPGLHSSGILPGNMGQSIIAGHRDTHFEGLRKLNAGDLLSIQLADGRYRLFKIDQINIVSQRGGGLVIGSGDRRLTLVTCEAPMAGQLHSDYRLLVSAHLVATSDHIPFTISDTSAATRTSSN